ncbi:hypothetical protein [Cryptosporangium aurantiacum]|uniref:Uncharacterized protein n=1 Tax=Cryptosporangium aurantiacum TaxID=134849 RepID=A0A1M7RMF6_9ACTN|nr:hypothetical protein [Cryptosporangium aurantiacum]SHN47379.1 hypothetical protein SAMN05443668_12325 [Cryptosporangium aurantiacum]
MRTVTSRRMVAALLGLLAALAVAASPAAASQSHNKDWSVTQDRDLSVPVDRDLSVPLDRDLSVGGSAEAYSTLGTRVT